MTKPTSVNDADAGASPAEAAGTPPGAATDSDVASAGIGSTSDDPYPDGYSDVTEPDGAVGSDDELPGARALWILAFTFAIVGLFFPLAGLIAIGCGALAWRRGSGRGRTATLVAIGTTLVGIILTIIVLTT
ncbi:hypothetical protein [Frankia sp. AgB32]|uniref:hypothetical protein n=1 Tax=Frankia sp. AgB32 TaxID=631119 RepID=UPI00200F678A|nr:hypothetical protein [Frankia sp. AgB32]MCK9894750.1 hypothetical protein [Frankia sp. AgB32]